MESSSTHTPPASPLFYGERLYPASPLSWLVPLWAYACGAAASGAWKWSGVALLRLLLGLLLAGPLLGLVWGAVLTLRSSRVLWLTWALGLSGQPQAPTDSARADDTSIDSVHGVRQSLPYTQPGSASHRATAWLVGFVARWEHARHHVGQPLVQLAAAALFSLVVAVQLGKQPFILATAGLTMVLTIGFGLSKSYACLFTGLPVALAWLLGHASYAALTPLSAALAASFGWAICSSHQVDQGLASPARQAIPQVVVAGMLVAIKQPIAASIVASLASAGLLLSPLLEEYADRGRYFGAMQAAVAASMVIAALAAGYRP